MRKSHTVDVVKELLSMPAVGYIRRQDAMVYAPVQAIYSTEPAPENGFRAARLFSLDQIEVALERVSSAATAPLSDERIEALMIEHGCMGCYADARLISKFARAIEQAHGIGVQT